MPLGAGVGVVDAILRGEIILPDPFAGVAIVDPELIQGFAQPLVHRAEDQQIESPRRALSPIRSKQRITPFLP